MHHGLLLPNLSYKDLKQKITNLFTTTRHKFWASGDFLRISWFPMESSWIVISYSSPINMRVSTFSTVVRRSRDTAATLCSAACSLQTLCMPALVTAGLWVDGARDQVLIMHAYWTCSQANVTTLGIIKVSYRGRPADLWPSHGESSHVLSCIITFEIWKERFCIIMSDHFTCH